VGLTTEGTSLVEGTKTRALISLLANVGVALYVFARVKTPRQRNFVLGCLGIGLAFTCFVGLMQSVSDVDLRYLFEPPGFVRNTDADAVALAERFGAKRVMGTAQHPIEFSVLAVVALLLMSYFARYATRRSLRWGAAVVFVMALVAMPAAVSRSGVIALAAAVAVFVWSMKVRHLTVGLVAAVLGIGAYMQIFPNVGLALWNTITHSEEDPSIMSRTSDYALVSKTFHAHPLFGLGLGASPPTEYGYLDNQWLQAVVQGGLVGIAAMVLLAVGGIFGIAAALRNAEGRRERDQAYMLGAVFVAIMACSFTFDLFAFEQASRILFLTFALLWCNFTCPLDENASATGGSGREPMRGMSWRRYFPG
jgi:O-antigen ligase